ncbi:alginate lyase family protein [Chthonobacter albigriseus]|uniref:alginate lyase family protein n=1 Tax=Chthonobacter albigriseus TaxID=1683161 RepID=UPI0015EF6307|nr:alginate lyase family protein [Chthonobacter albigriseus]
MLSTAVGAVAFLLAAAPVVTLPPGAPTVLVSSEAACAAVSGPVMMPATQSKYITGDETRSVTDPTKSMARARQLQAVRAFVEDMTVLANRWQSSGGGDLSAASCVLTRLSEWADAGSFLGLTTEDAYLTRDVLVADLAEAYRRVADAPLPDADRAGVEAWLRTIGQDTIAFYEYSAGPRSRANNHRYWAGVSVGTIGVATADRSLTAWASESLRLGLCQVREDGALPLELDRGRRALEYHVYALRALTRLEAVLAPVRAAGDGGACVDGLRRLRVLTVDWYAGRTTPSGVRQEPLPAASRRFLAEASAVTD